MLQGVTRLAAPLDDVRSCARTVRTRCGVWRSLADRESYGREERGDHLRTRSFRDVMLPAARNTELKGLLTAVRPAVAAHLAHAEQVRADVLAKK